MKYYTGQYMEEAPAEKAPVPPISKLPSISNLLFQSLDILQKTLVSLFIVNFVEAALGVGLLILLGMLVKTGLGFVGGFSETSITGIISLFITVYIWGIFVTTLIEIADILIIDTKGQISLQAIFKRSFKIVLPLSILGLLVTFLTTGGYFLLLIPGIFFSFFFTFTIFEFVLDNQSFLQAIKKSHALVRRHFWPVIGRLSFILLLEILYIAFVIIGDIYIKTGPLQEFSWPYSLAQFIIRILLTWFAMVYNITLYKQLKSLDPVIQPVSIRWISIASIVGWIVGVTLVVYLGIFAFRMYQSAIKQIANQTTIIAPGANETLCLGKHYNIQWRGPIPLHRVSFGIYYPSNSSKSNQTDYLKPAKSTKNGSWDDLANDEAKGVFEWQVGETNGGTGTPEGNGYRLVLNGFKSETGNNTVNGTSELFNIANCSGKRKNIQAVPLLKEAEITSPQAGETVCLGQNYTIHWRGTKTLYNPEFIIYAPQENLVYNLQPALENLSGKQALDTFIWKVGETAEGPMLPEASGYRLDISGKTSPYGIDSLYAYGNTFNIRDCSNPQRTGNISTPTFKNEGGRIKTQLYNRAFCEGRTMSIEWEANGAIRSARMNLLEGNIQRDLGTAMQYNTQATYNSGTGSTFGWTVGSLVDGTKVQPGNDYRLQLITHYDDGDVSTETGIFSIKNCLPPNNPSLVGEWDFEEGNGTTTYDTSGKGNTGIIQGAAWTAGKTGSALQFNGLFSYVDVGNGASLNITNAITVEGWIKPESLANYPSIVNNSEYNFQIGATSGDGRVVLEKQGVTYLVIARTPLLTDQWYHVAATYDGTIAKIYINGKLNAQNTAANYNFSTAANTLIGYYSKEGSFNGIIDDVRIYNYARTPDQIALDYSQ